MTNEIDWSQIHGAYGVVEDMPERLKAIADGDNDSFDYSVSQIEHQGTLYPLTVQVVPFLLEILNTDNKADKVNLIDELRFIIGTVDETCSRLSNFRGEYPKLLMDLHSEFMKSAPVYLKLLNDTNPSIRVRASLLVAMFIEKPTARNAIQTALAQEQDNITRSVFIYMLGQLIPRINQMPDKEGIQATQSLLLQLINNDSSPQIRLASALAWVIHQAARIFGITNEVPKEVFDVLLNYVITDFQDDTNDLSDDQISLVSEHLRILQTQRIQPSADRATPTLERMKKLSELMQTEKRLKNRREKAKQDPFKGQLPEYLSEYFEPQKVFRMLRAINPKTLSAILNSPKITPLMAHLVCLDILDKAFARKFYRFERGTPIEAQEDNIQWQTFLPYYLRDQKKPFSIMYQPPLGDYYNLGEPLKLFQYNALKTVVECDKFWELPTNLFSFFYGLPDDREALRELVTKNKPSHLKD